MEEETEGGVTDPLSPSRQWSPALPRYSADSNLSALL